MVADFLTNVTVMATSFPTIILLIDMMLYVEQKMRVNIQWLRSKSNII